MKSTSALILTFSLKEKEQPLSAAVKSEHPRAEVSHSFAKRLETIPPLRSIGWRGEGRGEVRFFRLTSKLALLLGFILLHSPFCLHAQSYSIDWHKVAGGGGTSTNSQYSVSGTIGQADASGAMTSGQYSVTGGFWSLIQVVQTSGAPILIITHVGNQAIVSWDPSATGWTLQTNDNLTTGTWGNYLGQAANNSATNSPPTGKVFFRLKK